MTAKKSRQRAHGRPSLRKELGQHHLRDGGLVQPLIDFLEIDVGPAPGRPAATSVLEIGPGGGVLTLELLAADAPVVAVELDTAWAFELRQRLKAWSRKNGGGVGVATQAGHGEPGKWAIVVGDAMDLDFGRLRANQRIAGNLPYGVATALLRKILATGAAGLKLGFLVQLEVAKRICAQPGESDYGALSVQVRARTRAGGEARVLGRVRPGSFVPPPKVESAFVGLQLIESPIASEDWGRFCDLVFAGFAQRRKTVRNSLMTRYAKGKIEPALDLAEIDPRSRAEVIDVDGWLRLFGALHPEQDRALL